MVASGPAIHISARDLAQSLATVLRRIERERVRYVVTDAGRTVATLAPPETVQTSGVTLGELVERLRGAPRPDARFADDLEAIHAGQPPLKETSWGS